MLVTTLARGALFYTSNNTCLEACYLAANDSCNENILINACAFRSNDKWHADEGSRETSAPYLEMARLQHPVIRVNSVLHGLAG